MLTHQQCVHSIDHRLTDKWFGSFHFTQGTFLSFLIFFFWFLYSSLFLLLPCSLPLLLYAIATGVQRSSSPIHILPSFSSPPVITLSLVTVEGRPRQGGFAQLQDIKYQHHQRLTATTTVRFHHQHRRPTTRWG